MKWFHRAMVVGMMVMGLLFAGLMGTPSPAAADGPYLCLPTCNETDARFLEMAGSGLETLAGMSMRLDFVSPAGQPTMEIGIFDGDTSGRWDLKDAATGQWERIQYTLFADPAGDGSGMNNPANQLGQWLSTNMADNAWFTLGGPSHLLNSDLAKSPSGNYFYNLIVTNLDPTLVSSNAFKVRTDSSVHMTPMQFAVMAPLNSLDDVRTVYPGWPSMATTTYDGVWDFYLDVPLPTSYLAVWDGDMDYGSWDCLSDDTDDPDTVGVPDWAAGTPARPEGVAVSPQSCTGKAGLTTGYPADDARYPGYRRQPNIAYEVIDSNGNVYSNSNPSGNLEWEQFRIDSNPNTPADVHVGGALPAGLYRVHVRGLDLSNLNAFRFDYDTLGVDSSGTPRKPLRPYLVGDTVWYDANGNGVQDGGEPGLQGIVLRVLDSSGGLVDTATTDANGHYLFQVIPGSYAVEVAPENFTSGGRLFGAVSTVGSNALTRSVTNDNVLTFDFGYQGTGSIGDRVLYDANGNGAQDGADKGLAGVTVNLLDGSGALRATTVSDVNGNYTFNNLLAGSYTVAVVASTLPGGATPSYDLDIISSPDTAAVTLAAGNINRTDVDFGYKGTGSIGDQVLYDVNANDVQDAGDTGLAGVALNLRDGSGNLLAITTTNATGNYTFNNLLAGSYTVSVDPTTLPSGTATSYDLDGIATANTAAVTLGAGQNRTDADFGYKGTGSISNLVWYDPNSNPTQEAGELAIANATVKLLDSSGNVIRTTTTDANGNYVFGNLFAGAYNVSVDATTLPAGLAPSYDLDGIASANVAAAPLTAGNMSRTDADFGYKGTTALATGNTATIGYWQNKNGQALINSLNGGPTSTALATWLATDFPYLYGVNAGANNLTGKTNADVAALVVQFFSVKGQKTDAQVLGGALAVYVTDSDLAGTAASKYGFSVSVSGTGGKLYNAGSNGSAIGLTNNTPYLVWQLLQQANLQKQMGTFNANAFNTIFDGINRTGDIK